MKAEDFSISTDKTLLNIDLIHQYLSEDSYWAKGRSKDLVSRSIENSLCFGMYDRKGEQVGFGRVVTDYSEFAWILDFFILKVYQKKGLGKRLMSGITEHKELQDIHRWGLGTRDAHKFYMKFGFEPLRKPALLMEKVDVRGLHER